MLGETLSLHIVDTGDNYPIHYKVSNRTTAGATAGWHLVELLDETFERYFTFRYDMLDQFIEALQRMKQSLGGR